MEWGEDCMDRFVGMFAFAILDDERGDVALVRDRYGIKPLYYARSGSHLLFASEIKALMGLLERPQVDRHSLLEWSLYRNVDALTPETLVEDVRSVLPGHVVRDQQRRDIVQTVLLSNHPCQRGAVPASSGRSPRRPDRRHGRDPERGGEAAADQRRAGRHAAERRPRFEPGNLDRGQVHARPDGVPRLGRGLSQPRRTPARRGADQALRPAARAVQPDRRDLPARTAPRGLFSRTCRSATRTRSPIT